MTPKPVRVSVFGKTDVGRTRDHNEDTFLVADLSTKKASLLPEVREHTVGPRGSFFMVADGMGGAAAGEVASAMAADLIYQHLSTAWVNDHDASAQRFAFRMKEAVEVANQKIHQYTKDHPEVRGMGTTLTAAGVFGGDLYLTQIGDSRGYLIRQGQAIQLTKDQSLMQRLVDAGELTEEEAEVSERRNIILQALGPDPRVRVDLTYQPLRRGDVLVLCSDGLSGQVKKDEIAKIATEHATDLGGLCSALIDLANERGGPDNITAIAVRFDGEALPAPGGDDDAIGHQVYPLQEGESTTEPVPVYRGSAAPTPKGEVRGRFVTIGLIIALVLGIALAYAEWAH
ncbi:MAG TPA: protein phosphatase 2C domain-containing protein [Gemmatimonadales bacterium]|nr:protein phosphatase 2C domain-containing protein [Gemmatimonadales bacterium]